MKPIEFVVFRGDSCPNDPVYLIAEAMKKHIRIVGEFDDYEVCAYYHHEGRMILEIRPTCKQ
jgi:hypothetical protein